jgi:hypothetical protein
VTFSIVIFSSFYYLVFIEKRQASFPSNCKENCVKKASCNEYSSAPVWRPSLLKIIFCTAYYLHQKFRIGWLKTSAFFPYFMPLSRPSVRSNIQLEEHFRVPISWRKCIGVFAICMPYPIRTLSPLSLGGWWRSHGNRRYDRSARVTLAPCRLSLFFHTSRCRIPCLVDLWLPVKFIYLYLYSPRHDSILRTWTSVVAHLLYIFVVQRTVPPDHLLLDSAPNLEPLISRWEINKFENCWYKSVRILEVS